jgi:glycosyltransferase involved in cell wall biosynthesis
MYIARMDADDEMHPERLQQQKNFLDQNPEIGVVSSLVKFGGDRETKQGYALHVDWINSLITHDDIYLNRFVESPVCNPSVMFRRELTKTHGAAVHGDFPEDYEMWLRWMEGGVLFGKVAEELHVWNDPPQRITRNDDRYSNEAFEKAKRPYLIAAILKLQRSRPIYVCGAGRVTRQRSDLLLAAGIQISGYIDVDPSKVGKLYNGIPVHGIDKIKCADDLFVISSVGNRGARESIRRMLLDRNFTEGNDFLLAQ